MYTTSFFKTMPAISKDIYVVCSGTVEHDLYKTGYWRYPTDEDYLSPPRWTIERWRSERELWEQELCTTKAEEDIGIPLR